MMFYPKIRVLLISGLKRSQDTGWCLDLPLNRPSLLFELNYLLTAFYKNSSYILYYRRIFSRLQNPLLRSFYANAS